MLCGACGINGAADDPDDESWLSGGKADGQLGMGIAATHLDVDLGRRRAIATIELEQDGHVALEAGDLTILGVSDDRGARRFGITRDLLLVANVRGPLVVEYAFQTHDASDGLLSTGSTVLWPYHCGNLFPCHSEPADGMTFTLRVDNVPANLQAIYPDAIDAPAPSYMLAWAVGPYGAAKLGTTAAGTDVHVAWLPGGEGAARYGARYLVQAFDWLERTLGPYAFGRQVGSVSVEWGPGAYGGMEHHPFWHVASGAMNDAATHVHEAAHGWFGDAVRLRCWEDFVLSEGTVSYLTARALGQVAGSSVEAQVWADYQAKLDRAIAAGGAPAWPTGCNQIDIINDRLLTNLPYMQGAFFYKDVADHVGAETLDGVISAFYRSHRLAPAGMQDMIDAIREDTGFDATAIAQARLRRRF